MAKHGYIIKADASACNESIDELRVLYGDGAGVPTRVRRRIERLLSEEVQRDGGLVATWRMNGDTLEVLPGHELLSVLVDLRAVRRM